MMASSHIVVGGAAWLCLSNQFGLPFDPLALGFALLGSLAPDIDHPKSTLGRLVKPVSVPISVVFGHRGITHSTLAILGCAWMLREHAAYSHLLLPFLIGYISHLAGDLLTPAGLPLLWPMKRRRAFALPIIKTGGLSERILVTLLVGWMISGLFGCHWPAPSFDTSWQRLGMAALPLFGEEPPAATPPPLPQHKPLALRQRREASSKG